MINTFYHRNQKPWTYTKQNNNVGLVLRTIKNKIKKVEVYYCDPMGDWTPNGYKYTKQLLKKVGETSYHDMWEGEMRNQTKRYRYSFKIYPLQGKPFYFGEGGRLKDINDTGIMGKGFTYSYWSASDFMNVPSWYRKTSWYQIFPDRFAKASSQKKDEANWSKIPKAHEFYGGDIKGIISKLEHIKSLGFNGIYFTPVFAAHTSHRYETNDYYKIDPRLGTELEFKELIKKTHDMGMKIMLDAVFNHIGSHSMPFLDVIKNKEKSKYKDWFWINDFKNIKPYNKYKGNEFKKKYPYETFAIVPEMPRLNWDNPEVSEYLIKAAEKWTKMGIDGWRLDVSFEPPLSFWRKLNTRLKKINKDILIVGEVWWDSINWLENDIWHGVMNYPLRDIIIDYTNSKTKLSDMKRFVERFNDLSFTYNPEQQWGMFNLMSSHDVPRLITLFNNDEKKYKFAMELCYLQPGSPSTYYGQEIGLEGQNDPDNRRTYPWSENQDKYFKFFKRINKERLEFVNTSDIFDRFVAQLKGNKIILSNSNYEIIINKLKITKRKKNGKKNSLKK